MQQSSSSPSLKRQTVYKGKGYRGPSTHRIRESTLIKSVLGRCVPPRRLPLNVGVTVMNVSTAAAIATGSIWGFRSYRGVVTVTGPAIQRPSNLMVKIGTSVRELVEQCGGFSKEPSKVLIRGSMMGFAASSLDVPIGKGSSGIVAFKKRRRGKGSITVYKVWKVCGALPDEA